MIICRELDAGMGLRKGARGVAIGELADRYLVALRFRVQERSGFFARLERIDHHRQIAVVDAHEIGRVLGEISVIGDDEDKRFADITDPADGQRPLMHRRL